MTVKQMERCRQRLKTYLEEMLTPLGRSERRYWGGVYVRGLLLDGERKSAGAIATRLPEANEQTLQQFLSQSPWGWEPIWQAMAQRIEDADLKGISPRDIVALASCGIDNADDLGLTVRLVIDGRS